MQEGKPSQTALLVAGYRARATRRASPICHDPWAAALAGEEAQDLTEAFDVANPHMELWIAVRTAFLDERIVRRAEHASQVVILGAGLDSRAARLPLPHVRFFEVDAPASQAVKLARARTIPNYPLERATYVPCDFEREDFLSALLARGFDANEPAVFVWEGVSYYLPESAVRATLRRIGEGCHEETTVLFDLFSRRFVEGRVRPEDRRTGEFVETIGEPFRWGTNDVLPLLYEEGYRRVRITSFDEACLNCTGTYARERKFRFQQLVEARRGGDVP